MYSGEAIVLPSVYRTPFISQVNSPNKYRTSRIERLLIFVTLVLLPLQSYIPTIGGFSILFFMFILLIVYQGIKRPSILSKLAKHKIILFGFAFILIGFFMETLHNSMNYYYVVRIGLMFFGALTIALFCRDRKSLQACLYGILCGSCIVSVVLFLTTYGVLSGAQAEDFKEVNRIRAEAFSNNVLESDLNMMALQVGQGFLIALAFMITARSKLQFLIFLIIGAFNLITSFLPISRGSIAIIFISAMIMIYAYGMLKSRIVIIASVFLFCAFLFIPEVVFVRFVVDTETKDGQYTEGRTRVISAALEELPNFIMTGVGIKNFYGDWGRMTSFAKQDGSISGAHNCFIQVAIFWGLPGLITLILIVFQTYKCFPKASNLDPLYLSLLGISTSTFFETFVVHTLESKSFSITLGLIIGSSMWVYRKNKKYFIVPLKDNN